MEVEGVEIELKRMNAGGEQGGVTECVAKPLHRTQEGHVWADACPPTQSKPNLGCLTLTRLQESVRILTPRSRKLLKYPKYPKTRGLEIDPTIKVFAVALTATFLATEPAAS